MQPQRCILRFLILQSRFVHNLSRVICVVFSSPYLSECIDMQYHANVINLMCTGTALYCEEQSPYHIPAPAS
ncbi:hypothetical protein OIDMADRAFT_18634 [Oidiodendron maius Zn]|uniref:Uncharacterized protein n=1 Tax=Oidiodendron maius (strain Zn) TaxID=913774 RepID=A0A0C3HHB6_OIDMZ|nr:hypothetical protein OIDMADRAFT_18634 [Oidiodendron maius Zn]